MTQPRAEGDEQLRADLASLRIERGGAPQPVRRSPPRRRWPLIVLAFVIVTAVAIWSMMGRTLPVTVAHATVSTQSQAGPAPVLSGSGYIVTGDRYVSIGV